MVLDITLVYIMFSPRGLSAKTVVQQLILSLIKHAEAERGQKKESWEISSATSLLTYSANDFDCGLVKTK